MREIKFRAWDKRRNKWIEQESLVINNGLLYEDRRDFEDGEPLSDDDAELVGYTGQYDPTATEFCEGDIIKDHTDYWEVKFFDGAFWIVAIGGNAKPELLCGNDYMEIIGNRFENPELLKDGNR